MSVLLYTAEIQFCPPLSPSPLNFQEPWIKASGRMGGFPLQLLAAQSNCDDRQAFFLSWQPACDGAPVIPDAS